MPCNAFYTRFIFGKLFIWTIIWYTFLYALLFAQNFYSCEKWVLHFWRMRKECCGTREGFVCLTSRNWKIRYFMRHMSLLIPYFHEGIRCTMISRPHISDMEWRETLPSMLLFATLVSESRLNINDLLDCCSRCMCLSGSGKKLPCILSWVCQELSRDTIPLG
jgi:hypothetical protein